MNVCMCCQQHDRTHTHTHAHTRCSGMSSGAARPKIRSRGERVIHLDEGVPCNSINGVLCVLNLSTRRVSTLEEFFPSSINWLKAFPFFFRHLQRSAGSWDGTLADIKRSSVFSHIVKVITYLFVITAQLSLLFMANSPHCVMKSICVPDTPSGWSCTQGHILSVLVK